MLQKTLTQGGVKMSPFISTSFDEIQKTNIKIKKCNDPSAGSPTDTLLRLLLPLNDTI